jgi:hypothetical protein
MSNMVRSKNEWLKKTIVVDEAKRILKQTISMDAHKC